MCLSNKRKTQQSFGINFIRADLSCWKKTIFLSDRYRQHFCHPSISINFLRKKLTIRINYSRMYIKKIAFDGGRTE